MAMSPTGPELGAWEIVEGNPEQLFGFKSFSGDVVPSNFRNVSYRTIISGFGIMFGA